jgi:SAM-dependent methyltransferase
MREDDIRPKPLLDEFFARLTRDAHRLAVKRPMFVSVACGFCGAAAASLAFEKDGFPYCRCDRCGSLFANPRPTAAALIEYAETSEAVAFWSSHFYRETADARREHVFRPRARLAAEVAYQHGMSGSLRFADVGAGYALFLRELAPIVPAWNLAAIEPDRRLAEICRGQGFETIERWVEDIQDGELALDFVSAFEVLEHVFDPATFLRGCRRLLRPGGLALVTTLTISGFDLQVLGAASRSITPPQHLNFPSVTAVEALASRVGLDVVELSTPGQLDVDIVRNVLQDRPDAVRDGFARSIASADESTRVDFQRFLQTHRLSSHLRCVLRRPR